MLKSDTIGKLAEALAKAQGAFPPVLKTRHVDYPTSGGKIKYSYADLADVLEASRKPLSDNGLALTQLTRIEGQGHVLTTTLAHASGEWLASEWLLSPQSKGPQAEGSSLTYARRYTAAAILGIASEEDDDGEAAMDRQPRTAAQQRPAQAPQTHQPAAPAPQDEYFCQEHQARWFRTANMKSYAHPIGETGKWCHMSASNPGQRCSNEAATPTSAQDWDGMTSQADVKGTISPGQIESINKVLKETKFEGARVIEHIRTTYQAIGLRDLSVGQGDAVVRWITEESKKPKAAAKA